MCKLRRVGWPGPSLNGDSVLGQVESPDDAAAGNQISAKCIDLSSRAGVQDDGLRGQRSHKAVALSGQGRCGAPVEMDEWGNDQHSLSIDS